MKAGVPFRAAQMMFAAIAAAMAIPMPLQRAQAMADIGPYKGRGKGRGTPSRNWLRSASRYKPHQGLKEVAKWRKRFADGTHGHAAKGFSDGSLAMRHKLTDRQMLNWTGYRVPVTGLPALA